MDTFDPETEKFVNLGVFAEVGREDAVCVAASYGGEIVVISSVHLWKGKNSSWRRTSRVKKPSKSSVFGRCSPIAIDGTLFFSSKTGCTAISLSTRHETTYPLHV